jgi:predicted small metal-binding protein
MKSLKCACGWEVSGTEDEVVAATQEHAEKIHNMRASREDVLSRIEVANLDGPK